MSAIRLRLKAPMQSWCKDSYWDDEKKTSSFPTRTGLAGMIGCAMGIKRGDSRLDDLRKLEMYACYTSEYARMHAVIYKDFQTVRPHHQRYGEKWQRADHAPLPKWSSKRYKSAGRNEDAIIRRREYVVNGDFTVFIVSDNEELLDKILYFLDNPVWAYYLGKKSCLPAERVPEGRCKFSTEEEKLCIRL